MGQFMIEISLGVTGDGRQANVWDTGAGRLSRALKQGDE